MIISICVAPDTLSHFPEVSGEVVFLSKTLGHLCVEKGEQAALERVESRLFTNPMLTVDVVNEDREYIYERPIPRDIDVHLVIKSNISIN